MATQKSLTSRLEHEKQINVSNGLVTIESVRIQSVDLALQIYRGLVVYLDHIEGSEGCPKWEARPSDEHTYNIDGREYGMQVEATEDFLGDKIFSLLPELNDEIRKQVVRTIAEFNPELPCKN